MTRPFRPGDQVHIPGRGTEQWIIDHINADTGKAQLHNSAGDTATGPLEELILTAWEHAARAFENPPAD